MEKRNLFVLFFVSLIILSVVFVLAQEACVDTDGGINLGVKGKAYGNIPRFSGDYSVGYRALEDTCEVTLEVDSEGNIISNWLYETICTSDGPQYIDIYCNEGCDMDRNMNRAICINSSQQPIDSIACTDSDGGINPSVNGTVQSQGYSSVEDECLPGDGTILREYYCQNSGFFSQQDIHCLDGCQNGACISNNYEFFGPPPKKYRDIEKVDVLYAVNFTATAHETGTDDWLADFTVGENNLLPVLYGVVNITFKDGSSKVFKFMRIGSGENSKRFIEESLYLQFFGYVASSKSLNKIIEVTSSDKIFEGYNTKLDFLLNISNVEESHEPSYKLSCGQGGCVFSSSILKSSTFSGFYEVDLNSLEEAGNRENILIFT